MADPTEAGLVLRIIAVIFLIVFILWCFSPPKRGGMSPRKAPPGFYPPPPPPPPRPKKETHSQIPRDTIRVDHDSLRAAKQKYRTLVVQLEKGQRSPSDMLHPAYKLGQFLEDALGVAWREAETRAPDTPPEEA